MDKSSWQTLATLAGAVAGLAVLHGLTTQKWSDFHRVAIAVGLMATVVATLD